MISRYVFEQQLQRGQNPVEHRGTFVSLSFAGPLRPVICPFRPEIYPLRPKICPLRPDIYPLRPEICPLRPEICPLRPEIHPPRFKAWEGRLQAWEGRFQAWKGRFQAWKGRFQAWKGLGEMDGQTDGWMGGRIDRRIKVPYGAAALLPLTAIYNHAKQDNGYRWPHIALGQLVFFFFIQWNTVVTKCKHISYSWPGKSGIMP